MSTQATQRQAPIDQCPFCGSSIEAMNAVRVASHSHKLETIKDRYSGNNISVEEIDVHEDTVDLTGLSRDDFEMLINIHTDVRWLVSKLEELGFVNDGDGDSCIMRA